MKAKITKKLIDNLVKKGATYTPPKENSLGVVESFLDLTTIKKWKVDTIAKWKALYTGK